jgi:hypothetical protein
VSSVFGQVARLAQRQPVGYIVAQSRESGEGLDMVRVQVPASLSASSAGVVVAPEYIGAPCGIAPAVPSVVVIAPGGDTHAPLRAGATLAACPPGRIHLVTGAADRAGDGDFSSARGGATGHRAVDTASASRIDVRRTAPERPAAMGARGHRPRRVASRFSAAFARTVALSPVRCLIGRAASLAFTAVQHLRRRLAYLATATLPIPRPTMRRAILCGHSANLLYRLSGCHAPDGSRRAGALLCPNYTTGRA